LNASQTSLRRSLGVTPIVFLGLAYMSPFAVFDTFGVVSDVTNGHVPASYILITIAILFTALSYGKMAKLFPDAGSAYTYTKKTMNGQVGFLVGWSALLDYLFLPMINAVLAGIYLSASFPHVPAWIWMVGLIVLITILNIAGIKIAVSANTFFVLFQLLVAILFVILTVHAILSGNHQSGFSVSPFFSHDMKMNLLFSGASILALSFLGFDAVTTLAEETLEPKKNIPKGIFLIALIGGVFFILVTYFMQALYPDVSILKNIDGASPEIAKNIGGLLFQSIFTSGALISVVASGLAAQTSASRLLYSMGRDGVIPKKWFGSLHKTLKTPVFNIVFIGIISLSALFLDLVTATSLINFGAFTAFSFVNLSVIIYYFKNKQTMKFVSFISYVLFPVIGLAFLIYLWISLDKLAVIFGLSWFVIGLIYLFFITKGFKIKPPEYTFVEN